MKPTTGTNCILARKGTDEPSTRLRVTKAPKKGKIQAEPEGYKSEKKGTNQIVDKQRA